MFLAAVDSWATITKKRGDGGTRFSPRLLLHRPLPRHLTSGLYYGEGEVLHEVHSLYLFLGQVPHLTPLGGKPPRDASFA